MIMSACEQTLQTRLSRVLKVLGVARSVWCTRRKSEPVLIGVRGSPGTAICGCCAAVPGTTLRGTFVPRSAAGSTSGSGATMPDFVLPGCLLLESSYDYLVGSKGFAIGRFLLCMADTWSAVADECPGPVAP